jgi:hypothetical protein
MKGKKVKFKGVLIAAVVLAAVLGAAFIIRENAEAAEFITRNITRRMSDAAGEFTSKFTFSFLEVGFIIVVVFAAVLIVLGLIGLKKKKFKRVFKGFLVILTVVIAFADFYMLTVGVTYYRAPIDLPVYGDFDERYGADEVQKAAESFLYDYSALYHKMEKRNGNVVISPYSFDELNDLLYEEFKRLDGEYFFDHTPRVKAIYNTWFLDLAGFDGIASVPFGEANIDAAMVENFMPATMAHEIAHIKGVMREAEANLVSAYILITSENEYLRYCGYLNYLRKLADAIRISDVYDLERERAFKERIDALSPYRMAARQYSKFEEQVLLPFFEVFDIFNGDVNDLYLKLNGAENGVGSYESPYGTRETGETRPDGRPVVKPVYSDLHKLFFSVYEADYAWLPDEVLNGNDGGSEDNSEDNPGYIIIVTEIINVPSGSLYLSMGEGFVIVTTDGVWTLYTTEDGKNKNQIIEPLFQIDFDALPESMKPPDGGFRIIRHGYYIIQFGEFNIADAVPITPDIGILIHAEPSVIE